MVSQKHLFVKNYMYFGAEQPHWCVTHCVAPDKVSADVGQCATVTATHDTRYFSRRAASAAADARIWRKCVSLHATKPQTVVQLVTLSLSHSITRGILGRPGES